MDDAEQYWPLYLRAIELNRKYWHNSDVEEAMSVTSFAYMEALEVIRQNPGRWEPQTIINNKIRFALLDNIRLILGRVGKEYKARPIHYQLSATEIKESEVESQPDSRLGEYEWMRHLPLRLREICYLKGRGLTHVAVAEALGVSEGTLYNRFKEMRKTLRAHLL